jgi:acetate---CoA ligase (ADP-forming)
MSETGLAQALLSPQSIALIGASADETKTGGRPLRYLLRHGYTGKIYPVNPRVEKVGDLVCYPDIASIPDPVDHAFIMLSGEAALAAVQACSEAKIPCATILAGGFAEAGENGAALQEKLLQVARDGNVRLLGPNSIGMINPVSGATLSANAMLELPELVKGRTAVVSQSGSMIGAFLSHGAARHVGFSKLISVGNEADLSVGEIADLLLEDDDTDVILLFLETIRDNKRLAEFARRAHEVGKPVVAYKLGRSNVGQELARSHTGAIAGSDEAIAAFLKQNGIARVKTFNGLIESPRLFAGRAPGSGKRVAVVSTTGGGGAMVVDNLGLRGVVVVEVPSDVSDALAAHNIAAAGARMIDLTMAGAKPEIVADVISRLMASDETDAVIMVVGSSAQFHPELAVDPLMHWRDAAKPFAVYLAPAAEDSLTHLANAGIAVFRTPEGCADAIHAVLSWTRPDELPDLGKFEALNHTALLPGQGLNEGAALALFSDLGISTARSAFASSGDEAVGLAQDMSGPVALKIASADIQHKSDMGGVHLGLESDEQVMAAFEETMANAAQHAPDAVIDGVLVQEMASGLGQVLLGFKRDPMVGPIVVLGVGGLLAEIYGDTALRMAPVNLDAARSMIEEVRGLAPLRGYRGATPGDLDALAKEIVNFSRLALREDIYEAEINPVLVRENGKGVIAVDGVVLGAASTD